MWAAGEFWGPRQGFLKARDWGKGSDEGSGGEGSMGQGVLRGRRVQVRCHEGARLERKGSGKRVWRRRGPRTEESRGGVCWEEGPQRGAMS